MKEQFTNLRATRQLIKKVIDGLSTEQLNKIPPGFNNNIAWNVGHILVTQQLLVYANSGSKPVIPNELIALFRKGTSPENPVTKEQLNEILNYLDSTITQTETDLLNDLFGPYKEYETSYGVILRTVEQAITFNNMHEALHLGYIMSMKHAL